MIRICSICVRKGSKGVPGKNMRDILGRPLIWYSIEQAVDSQLFHTIAVSTDCQHVVEFVTSSYPQVLIIDRPKDLATDTAPKIPAIRHCIQEAERLQGIVFDTVYDFDVTSPLRNLEDIKALVKNLEKSNAENIITGTKARRSPYFNLVELDDKGIPKLSKVLPNMLVRRQDSPLCFDMNASMYGWQKKVIESSNSLFHETTVFLEMPEERSFDIDSELDFFIVECLMKKRLYEVPKL